MLLYIEENARFAARSESTNSGSSRRQTVRFRYVDCPIITLYFLAINTNLAGIEGGNQYSFL
jgi:hypothetical protein